MNVSCNWKKKVDLAGVHSAPLKVLIAGFKGAAACTHTISHYLCHMLKSLLIKLGSKAEGKPGQFHLHVYFECKTSLVGEDRSGVCEHAFMCMCARMCVYAHQCVCMRALVCVRVCTCMHVFVC